MSLITSTDELLSVCHRLAAHSFVTVDTEFLRETTFWPKVCVIQLASDDEAVAVDTLAESLDLAPFFELMANPGVTKVFHAARQDIEIVWHLAKLIPAPLFDTQVAAMVCGFGDQVSYGELVQSVCKVTIDKSSRFTDWARRPLSDAQIAYAIADVTYLRDIYRYLHARLERSGRLHWLADEMSTLTSPATYEQHPENAWERLKHRARKPRDLAALMELAAWREHEAQTRDVPRSRVLKDDALIDIALAAPRDAEALGSLRSFPRGMERSRAGVEILAAIERGLARDPKSLPRHTREQRGGGGGVDGGTFEGAAAPGRRAPRRRGEDDRDGRRPRGNRREQQSRRRRTIGLAARAVRPESTRTKAGAPGAHCRERQGRNARMARGAEPGSRVIY